MSGKRASLAVLSMAASASTIDFLCTEMAIGRDGDWSRWRHLAAISAPNRPERLYLFHMHATANAFLAPSRVEFGGDFGDVVDSAHHEFRMRLIAG